MNKKQYQHENSHTHTHNTTKSTNYHKFWQSHLPFFPPKQKVYIKNIYVPSISLVIFAMYWLSSDTPAASAASCGSKSSRSLRSPLRLRRSTSSKVPTRSPTDRSSVFSRCGRTETTTIGWKWKKHRDIQQLWPKFLQHPTIFVLWTPRNLQVWVMRRHSRPFKCVCFTIKMLSKTNAPQQQQVHSNPTADGSRGGPWKIWKLGKLRVTAEISGNLKDSSGFHLRKTHLKWHVGAKQVIKDRCKRQNEIRQRERVNEISLMSHFDFSSLLHT